MTTAVTGTLIAGSLKPFLMSLPAARIPRRELGASSEEIDCALASLQEGRSIEDRTMDNVVDRLLEELSW